MSDYLIHYGIPGQKKGNRRFQYEDGTLTPEGKIRYRKNFNNAYTKFTNEKDKLARGKSTEEKVRSKAYEATNQLGGYYPVLRDSLKLLRDDDYRLRSTGENGRDFDDEYEYIRPHARKEYRKAYNQWVSDAKMWNTNLEEIGLDDNGSSYRVSQLIDYIESHKY